MITETKTKESGAVGQPGESTTRQANTLTSSGISSLLNSEFASEDTADTRGQETPPREEAEANHGTDRQAAGGAEAETAAEAGGEESAGTEAGAAADAAGAAALPEQMQAALDEWESKGGALPDALQHVVQKRIGRLTEEKHTAETKAAGLEADLRRVTAEAEQLRNDPRRPAMTFAGEVPDEKQLATTERAAKQFLNQAEAYLDESATDEERARVESFMEKNSLDANGLKRRVREMNNFLRDDLPGQKAQLQQFKQQEQTSSAQARRDFAWLNDANAPEQKVKNEMLKLLPDLPKRLPNYEMVMGIYMLGYKQYEAQLATGKLPGTNGKTAPAKAAPSKATPPPKAPAGNGATRGTPPRRTASTDATDAFSKAPTRDNAVNLARAALQEA